MNCRKLSPEKLQKLYKELYMRDDISVEEAKNIWQRFKDLDKIKDKEEYIKAVFEETKKNFGMTDRLIRLKRCKSLENLNGTERGACCRDNRYITITDSCKRDEVISTMHHEFRHAKQHELVHKLIYNTDPIYNRNVKLAAFQVDLIDLCIENQVKPTDKELAKLFNKYVQKIKSAKDINFDKIGMEKEVSPIIPLIKYIEKNYPEEVEKSVAKLMGESTPVPEKYMDFAKKCRDNFYNYVKNTDNKVGYWRQFVEVDAKKAGQKISDSLKLYFPE